MKTAAVIPGKLFLITAPSGAGKTTVVSEALKILAKERHETCAHIITYTTRAMRAGEVNGRDYHFLSLADFLSLREKDFFMESSCVYGNWYGVARDELDRLQKGATLFLIIDRQGAEKIKALAPYAYLIWLAPSRPEVAQQRLAARGTESMQDQAVRTAQLHEEYAWMHNKPDLFDACIYVDEKEKAVADLLAFVRANLHTP
jgi:guanylate kinase